MGTTIPYSIIEPRGKIGLRIEAAILQKNTPKNIKKHLKIYPK
jgi:hypothetical protein